MKILVTGVSGSGKTTIAAELHNRGYNAQNMDYLPGLCSWVNLATGLSEPDFQITSAADWEGKYDWQWNRQKLAEFLAEDGTTFYCGSAGNQDQFFNLFDKVFLLKMNPELIRERILNNEREHDYGKMPGEVEAIIGYHQDFQEKAMAARAITIDAGQPLAKIVDFILGESLQDSTH